MRISIIVPVLDEGPGVGSFLAHLRERAPGAEVVVVCDAGSQQVEEPAVGSAERVITSARGRAAQMNAGAAAAGGDVFWFVHADCYVPQDCLRQISRALDDSRMVGGCFRIRFPRRDLIYRISDACGNLAVELFGRCYGDHGIFCRRQVFMAVGGYPDLPLLEDAEFYRLLRRSGPTQQLRGKIITSPRRYEAIGPYRLTAAYVLISTLYLFRAPISFLARIYDRLCRCAHEPLRPKN
jgi:rSAM/selenodomain-associated transferase 2